MRVRALNALALAALMAAGCDPTGSIDPPPPVEEPDTVKLEVIGRGAITSRYSAELWIHEGIGYTTTWGNRGGRPGNTIYVWDVAAADPVLLDSVQVEHASTLGDVQVSDDGSLLVVAMEHYPNGSLLVFDLDDPRRPQLVTRYATANTEPGVHTAEVARVGGRLYAFLSVNPLGGRDPIPAKLVIVDLEDPAEPREVFAQAMGAPYVHDVFVRDGYLFTALWDEGLAIWDIGAEGGSVEAPVRLGTEETVGGNVHNVWWFHDQVSGERRYAFVGEEQGGFGNSSAGDIHVVDVSDKTNPREVAFFSVPGAGTHNFWMDEARGLLFAAYYNGGVRILDVRGDLSVCSDAARDVHGRCDLGLMDREVGQGLTDRSVYVWGVQQAGNRLYASDMHNGLWVMDLSPLFAKIEG